MSIVKNAFSTQRGSADSGPPRGEEQGEKCDWDLSDLNKIQYIKLETQTDAGNTNTITLPAIANPTTLANMMYLMKDVHMVHQLSVFTLLISLPVLLNSVDSSVCQPV